MQYSSVFGYSYVYSCIWLLCVIPLGMGPVTAKARMCETSSQLFNGPCLSTTNCANICQNEGFPDGDCKGFRLRCICNRPCWWNYKGKRQTMLIHDRFMLFFFSFYFILSPSNELMGYKSRKPFSLYISIFFWG